MSGHKFAKGDTVRVLNTHPDVVLHGKTGEVLGYTEVSRKYARVRVSPGIVELLLDTELELELVQ